MASDGCKYFLREKKGNKIRRKKKEEEKEDGEKDGLLASRSGFYWIFMEAKRDGQVREKANDEGGKTTPRCGRLRRGFVSIFLVEMKRKPVVKLPFFTLFFSSLSLY